MLLYSQCILNWLVAIEDFKCVCEKDDQARTCQRIFSLATQMKESRVLEAVKMQEKSVTAQVEIWLYNSNGS